MSLRFSFPRKVGEQRLLIIIIIIIIIVEVKCSVGKGGKNETLWES